MQSYATIEELALLYQELQEFITSTGEGAFLRNGRISEAQPVSPATVGKMLTTLHDSQSYESIANVP